MCEIPKDSDLVFVSSANIDNYERQPGCGRAEVKEPSSSTEPVYGFRDSDQAPLSHDDTLEAAILIDGVFREIRDTMTIIAEDK